MSTISLDNQQGVHIEHEIIFNGEVTDWFQKSVELSSISNEASTFDNKRRVSDVTMRVSDLDGEIWGSMGDGTTAFGKGLKVITTIGGQYGASSFGQLTGVGFTGTTGGTQYITHVGSVVEVQKSGRSVVIRSKNNMERINDLTIKPPVSTAPYPTGHALVPNTDLYYQDFTFVSNSYRSVWDDIVANGAWDISDDKTGCSMAIYGGFSTDISVDSTGLYDADTVTMPSKYYPKTDQWYRDHSKAIVKGTYLGTYAGTIGDLETANLYGFETLAEAVTAINIDGNGTYYTIDKMRFKWPEGKDGAFERIYPTSSITMDGDYTSILKHFITGAFVYRRFDSGDLDSNSFDKSSAVGAFSNFRGTILAKEDKLIPHIDDILASTSAMFSVNNVNAFEYLAYGPVEIVGNLGTILSKDVINTSYTNRQEDAYNAFELHYRYENDTDSYGTFVRGTLDNWTVDNERLLKLETKWMYNNNETGVYLTQLQSKYTKTAPVVNVTTSLNKGGVEIGDLLTVTDVDSAINERVLQVRKFNKDFSNGKTVDFEMLDGETIYYGRGWSFWGTQTNLTSVVDDTSNSGWADGSDNVANINTTVFGDNFKYW